MDEIKEVTLHNGAKVAYSIVSETMDVFLELFLCDQNAAEELIELAQDPDHTLFPEVAEVLMERHLLQQDGKMHPVIRDIIRSAVESKRPRIMIRSPIKDVGRHNA